MKKLINLLFAMPLLIASCSSDEVMMSEDAVEVTFHAAIPQEMPTRVGIDDLHIDQVVCVVYEGNAEVSSMREVKTVAADGSISFSPRLIKGRTYDIVFWAMTEGAYDVTDMQTITRIDGLDEKYYDAFTATTEIVVEDNSSKDISLIRPFAQLNVGVTPDDWNSVTKTFGMTPTTITLKAEGKNTFDALAGEATGNSASLTYNLKVTGDDFTCNSKPYKKIASCYVLAETEKGLTDIEFSLYDQDSDPIRENVAVTYVPLQRNHITNVVGGLLTGVITYEIAFEENGEFAGENPYEI